MYAAPRLKWKTWSFLLAISAISAVTGGAIAQAQGPGGQNPGDEERESQPPEAVEIVRIQYAEADTVASIVTRLSGIHGLIADDRTNSVLFSAAQDERERVIALIERLDQPVEDGGEEEIVVRVFQLEHIQGSEGLAEKLTSLFIYTDPDRRGRRVRTRPQDVVVYPDLPRIAVDASTNQLVVRAHPAELESLSAIIEQLDKPVADPPATGETGQFQVRLVWLVSGLDEASTAEVPPDLGEVVQELEQYGITGLRRAFQTMVRVNAGDEFFALFAAELDQRWQMVFSGGMTAAVDSDTQALPELRVNIEGDARREPSERAHVDAPKRPRSGAAADRIHLRTTINTKPGHFVVLGVTPIAQLESVFVIQVIALP